MGNTRRVLFALFILAYVAGLIPIWSPKNVDTSMYLLMLFTTVFAFFQVYQLISGKRIDSLYFCAEPEDSILYRIFAASMGLVALLIPYFVLSG
jgi:hypothetical protein